MLTRRQSLAAGAALPLATSLPARPAQAQVPMMGPSAAQTRRVALGDFEVTTLSVASFPREDPHAIFGLNVSEEEFAEVSEANFLSTEMSQFFFTPTVVNTGGALILFDSGLNAEGTLGALEAAGYSADQVDTVVLTHMHGDHIGGLMQDGSATFENADYVTGRVEFDHWAQAENDGFEANVRPLAEQMRFIEDGQDVVSGITGMAAFGHTPGHMVFRIESGGEALVLFADLANHPVWSLARPDWEVRFDMDKEAAAASRRRVLDMIAADRVPAVGYHLAFPAMGFVAARGEGFEWVPESGQLRG